MQSTSAPDLEALLGGLNGIIYVQLIVLFFISFLIIVIKSVLQFTKHKLCLCSIQSLVLSGNKPVR